MDPNPTAVGRTGNVQIAGIVFTVAQLGATCGYTVTPTNRIHNYMGGTSNFTVNTLPGCNWVVGNTNSWIQLISGSGIGTGTVTYTVFSNMSATTRSGNLLIGGQRFTVTQQPIPFACSSDKTVECGVFWQFDQPQSAGVCTGAQNIVVLSTTTNFTGICGGFTATRMWDASDACSNRFTCSQTVTVRDTTPPVLTCPTNKTAECGSQWTFDSPSATDACSPGGVTLRIVSTTTNFTCGNSYIATRTWEALDPCTNRTTCAQVVTVRDTTPPVISCPPARTVEFGSTWSFDTPTGTDSCDGVAATLRIVSSVTNTVGFCGPGFSVTRTWELSDICSNKITCSQTITVRDTTPPALTCPANKIVSCGQQWSFDTPTANDLGDGTDVLISIESTVTNGVCPGTFTVTRTWRAVDRCNNASTCSQVAMNSHATVGGALIYYPNSLLSIPAFPVRCNGSTNVTVQSGSDGSYSFNLNPGGTYTVAPIQPPLPAPGSAELVLGVTTFDISLIRRHILNPTNRFDSPYKLLAADVNTNGSVSTVDISMVRRFILGVSNTLPPGLWRYVPSDYSFPNPDSPWNAPASRVHSSLSSTLSGQNFYAIKMGDVNHTWTPPTAPSMAMASPIPAFESGIIYEEAEGSAVTFSVSCHTNAPAEPVTVYVKVRNFHDVTSVQFSMQWDPALLQYRETANYGLSGLSSGNFGTAMAGSGKLVLSWDDPSAVGVTLPDGTAVFSVTFDVVTQMDCIAPVHIVTNGSFQPEVAVNFELVDFNAQNGHVLVLSDHVQPPQLSGAGFQAGQFSLGVPTAPGRRYILEFTDSLSDSNWQAFEAIEGDGTVKILSDPSPNSQQRFYRIRVE